MRAEVDAKAVSQCNTRNGVDLFAALLRDARAVEQRETRGGGKGGNAGAGQGKGQNAGRGKGGMFDAALAAPAVGHRGEKGKGKGRPDNRG